MNDVCNRMLSRIVALTIAAVVSLLLFSEDYVGRATADESSKLQAGTAKVDITPANGTARNLTGQPLAPRESLFARVLVLKNEKVSIAIVSVDLIVFASPRVIAEAKAKWHVDHVVLSATHTHAAPAPKGMLIQPPTQPDWTRGTKAPADIIDWPGLSSDPWYAETEAKIIAAIGQAMQSLFSAKMVAGQGPFESAYMAHNRRLVTDKGVVMLWENPTRRPTQPIDPTVGVIRVDDLSGKPRALAVHYACHPVASMNAGVVSRDYPGAMVDHIEQELGSDCLALFLQGASGDIDPYDLQSLKGENRFNIIKQSGISLAKGALRVAAELKPQADNALRAIHVTESKLSIPNRSGAHPCDVGMLTVTIGSSLALVAIPGEPFIQHQLDLRARSPIANTFLLGLAYHGQGTPFVVYIPTAQAVKEGGYGATEASFIAADAGHRLIEEAVSKLSK